MKVVSINQRYLRFKGRKLSYSELMQHKAASEYTLLKAFRDYWLCLMSILLFGLILDLVSESDFSAFRAAYILCPIVPLIPPLLLYLLDRGVEWRNRKRTISMIQKLKVREFGEGIYLIKYQETGVYELTDTDAFVTMIPDQLAQIRNVEDAKRLIEDYKSI